MAEGGIVSTPKENKRMAIRGQIIALHQEHHSTSEIARRLGCDKTTVRRWVTRYTEGAEELGSLAHRPIPGGPRKSTQEEDNLIVRTSRENPFLTAAEISQREGLRHLSATTVRRRLKEGGRHHRRPASKQILSQANIRDRLRFCEKFGDKDFDYWSKVIFVDEKTFRSDDGVRLHCWRPNNTRYQPENLHLVRRSGHISANMFGWMWAYGVGELTPIQGRFTGDQYVEILEEVLLPSVRAMALPAREPILLVQDNSPVHTCRTVNDWFEDHMEFERLQWPARSPDFNPIEHLWSDMVEEWDAANERTPRGLQRHCSAVWERLQRSERCCENLVRSMPDRLAECVEARGGHTRY